uniref:Kunitz/Bovine pancreatic trypsin inhibitor domain protein n=1 Tax=Angiostrongylus cantonensis TaxID=6313 RepID=A0A158PC57_ANGCA
MARKTEKEDNFTNKFASKLPHSTTTMQPHTTAVRKTRKYTAVQHNASIGLTNITLSTSVHEMTTISARSFLLHSTLGTITSRNTQQSYLAQDEAIESPTSGFRHYRAEARAISNERVFQADLERQLASIKHHHENREDLAYSKLVNHPVTIASECLEPFDINLTKSCDDGKEWTSRYYFDRDLRVCRMYWHGGCFSSSRNDFANQESCMWRCMGQHTEPASKACLDPFDWVYHEDCRHGEFSDRYYFNHERKECKSFQWGGCQSPSQNFFATLDRCKELCESLPQEFAQSCLEPFDDGYRGSCSSDGRFKEYYYFDHLTSTCQMFWFGNCPGSSHNIYPTLGFCQWICERHRDERKPTYCSDKFDPTYRHSCGDGHWVEKAFFDHETGRCNTFWWDGCISTSQNIFNDLRTCQKLCEDQGEISVVLLAFICSYPAYYFDRPTRSCRPFSYSGCGGNENRFLTLSQCENLCEPFMHMTESEMDCHMPLENGIGSSDSNCLPDAGFRFYFSRSQGKCLRFWYQGCGGNANNFYSYEVCQRTCEIQMQRVDRKPRANSNGIFGINSAPYLRFPIISLCSYDPEWGSCNQLRYMWFYNQSSGRCDQFLYGGCGGNPNKFDTFEICQQTCELTGIERIPLLITSIGDYFKSIFMKHFRYYFNKRTRQCKGFHYTGCGKSGNNFVTKEECQGKCEKRYPRDVGRTSSAVPTTFADSRSKSTEKAAMLRHIILDGDRKYHKTEPEWLDYALCVGYRFYNDFQMSNISSTTVVMRCLQSESTLKEKNRTVESVKLL